MEKKTKGWLSWFEELGIQKKFWKDPKGFFLTIAQSRGLNLDEHIEGRESFEQMIEREWMVDNIEKQEDRAGLFWYCLLMNWGLTLSWYSKQFGLTKDFQKLHQYLNKTYEKIKKQEEKGTSNPEEIFAMRKEFEKEIAEIYIPIPIFYPMDQYDEPHRRENKGFLEFINHFVNLLKELKDNRMSRIYQIISLFFKYFIGVQYKPSVIKKIYLRSLD